MNTEKKYKIILVANSTWNFFNFRVNIIQSFLERGYEVVLVSPWDIYLDALIEQVKVRHIPIKHLGRKSINPVKETSLYYELLNIYKKERPDLAIHYTIKPNIYGNMAAKSLGITSVCVVTGLGYVFLHENFINTIAKRLYKRSFKKVDLVVFENADDQKLFIDEKLINKEKTSVVNGCGVNLEYFKPINEVLKSETKVVFSFIARLIYDKGILEFVEAARKVKNQYPAVEFWVAGEVDSGNPTSISHEMLHEWVENGIIKYFGHVKDVRNIISKSDCIVLPSYREAMARTLTEAFAMEKPVITCNTSGCNYIVDHGVNGYLVPIKDVAALAEAIERVFLMDEEERKVMGQKGRRKAADFFDERLVTQQFLAIVDQFQLNVG